MDPFAPGLLNRLPHPPQKVVLVRASRIGDFICATPALRALRAALPESEITLVGLPFVRDLVMRSPHLDRFVEFPGFPGLAEQFFDARRALAFFQEMQGEAFDLAVQLHGSGVYANPFTLMLGARWTAGFVPEGDWPSRLDAACPMPTTGTEVERWLALTTFLGAPEQGVETEFPIWRTDHVIAFELLGGAARPLFGVQPGAREELKRWPPGQFAEAAKELVNRMGGTIVVVGGPEERELGEQVAALAGAHCLNLVGQTSLPQLGAVISQLDLLLTNDSGPAHIAYASGTPSVTLFGGTDPARWGPPPLPRHQLVIAPDAPRDPSFDPVEDVPLDRIPVGQVIAAALSALEGGA